MNRILSFAMFGFDVFGKFRYRIHIAVLLTIIILPSFTKAQSRDITNPTPLNSKEISGVISDNVGDNYYYSFMAGPGELTIMLSVESDKKMVNIASVAFEISNEDAKTIGSKYVIASSGDARQAVERINFSRKQKLLLKIRISDNSGSGKYTLRLNGAINFEAQPLVMGGTSSDVTDTYRNRECLPKKGMLRVKMKDGSIKRIDLSQAEEITIEP